MLLLGPKNKFFSMVSCDLIYNVDLINITICVDLKSVGTNNNMKSEQSKYNDTIAYTFNFHFFFIKNVQSCGSVKI